MRRNEGFTLIELVVATAVLLVLTLIIGALFRQALSAWDTGRIRGEGGMIVRGLVGTVSKDLTTAIDGRPYGFDLPKASGSSLDFVCLRAAEPDESPARFEVHHITYSGATRTDRVRTASGWTTVSTVDLADSDSSSFTIKSVEYAAIGMPSAASQKARGYETETGFSGADSAKWGGNAGPSAVKIRVTFQEKGRFEGLAVRSKGPNGFGDEESGSKFSDDIVIQ
ncbi:MAG: prepilin-type N-terminal cleavage/methylation domain-containing protein [Kiritimatiellae bacterium]|nr:prepilin-type N-terminal cleavage/methylation domain-containing protein [Kiritimatiellia bacterium]